MHAAGKAQRDVLDVAGTTSDHVRRSSKVTAKLVGAKASFHFSLFVEASASELPQQEHIDLPSQTLLYVLGLRLEDSLLWSRTFNKCMELAHQPERIVTTSFVAVSVHPETLQSWVGTAEC